MSLPFAVGTILVPTDTPDSPNALIDAATGAVLANPTIPKSTESGAVWLDGTFALIDSSTANLLIYSSDFVQMANVSGVSSSLLGLTSDLSTRFYVAHTTTLTAYTSAGSVIATWTIPSVGNTDVIAVNTENTRMFYTTGNAGMSPRFLGVYDLVNSVDLGPIVNLTIPQDFMLDLLYVPTTPPSLLVILTQDINATPALFAVNRYALDGTLIQSYPLPDDSEWNDDPRLSLNLADPAFCFWVRAFPKLSLDPDVAHSIMRQVGIADGGVISVEYPLDDDTIIPFSCPFFAFGIKGPAQNVFIGTPVSLPIRRERTIALPIAPGNAKTTISRIELQFQPGSGTPGLPLANPKFFVQVSWDNGKNWSNERLMNAGREGAYQTRAFVNILGSGREPAIRIVTSDPFTAVLTDCFLSTSEGLH